MSDSIYDDESIMSSISRQETQEGLHEFIDGLIHRAGNDDVESRDQLRFLSAYARHVAMVRQFGWPRRAK